MSPASERGDIILGGLARTVLTLLVLALLVFELGAWATNVIQLDDLGTRVARSAAIVGGGSRSALEEAALSALENHAGVTLESVNIADGDVEVVLTRPAPVLVLDRISPLRDRLVTTVTKTVPVQP